jgi:hypothetical protein
MTRTPRSDRLTGSYPRRNAASAVAGLGRSKGPRLRSKARIARQRRLAASVEQPREGCCQACSCRSRGDVMGAGQSALRCQPALRSRRQSERSGTLRGDKAHGWIGCAASETAAVHYGLVSGVRPCSWAVSSPTSSSRLLETGGAGAGRVKPIPGDVLLAARQRTPGASISQPGLAYRHLRGSARGRQPSQLAAVDGQGAARTRSAGRRGFGRATLPSNNADFLADTQFRLRHLVSGTST